MSLPYYVEPEYWLEGYAEGDAKIASASTAISVIFTASARLKWEPEPDSPEVWTDRPLVVATWTDISDASEIWTEIA